MVWGNVDLWGFQSRERFLGLKALVSWLLKYGKATKLFVINCLADLEPKKLGTSSPK